MARLLPLLLLGLPGCGPAKVGLGDDTGDTATDSGETGGDSGETGETAADTADSGETGDTADTGPVDRDGDGYASDVDCADTDASIHPGQEERWNGLDDDCDGTADADGHYEATASVVATAVYKGQGVRFELSCPTTLDRSAGALTWAVTCHPDSGDDLAQILLGETLTVTGSEDGMGGASWDGPCTIASSNGWDADGDALATWDTFTTASLSFRLSASSLSVSGSARLSR